MYLIKIREDTEVVYDEDGNSETFKKEVYVGPYKEYWSMVEEASLYVKSNNDVTILEII